MRVILAALRGTCRTEPKVSSRFFMFSFFLRVNANISRNNAADEKARRVTVGRSLPIFGGSVTHHESC